MEIRESEGAEANMAKKITVKVVEALRADKRRDIWDADLSGFGVRVSPEGSKSFVVRYRTRPLAGSSEGGRLRRLTLGSAARLNLADARRMARDVLGRVARGEDPQGDRLAARRVRAAGAATFRQVAERLLAKAELGARTRREWRYLLDGHVLPVLGDRNPENVLRADVRELVASIADRTPTRANDVLKVIRWVYARAIEDEIVSRNPCVGLRKPAKEHPRERTLTNPELRALWLASQSAGLYGAALRLAMLSGLRREEVFSARREEIDREAGVWRIAGARTKNARPHDVPLTDDILGLLDEVDELTTGASASAWVFPGASAEKPVRPTSRAWARLLKAAGILALVNGGTGVQESELQSTEERRRGKSWRPLPIRVHDIRRTVRDRLTRDLRVAPSVAEAILGHVPPKLVRTYAPSGVALRDKRAALQRWGRELDRIVHANGEADRIVAFPEGA